MSIRRRHHVRQIINPMHGMQLTGHKLHNAPMVKGARRTPMVKNICPLVLLLARGKKE